MANLNKDITESTVRLTKEINRIIENYVANRKATKNTPRVISAKMSVCQGRLRVGLLMNKSNPQ